MSKAHQVHLLRFTNRELSLIDHALCVACSHLAAQGEPTRQQQRMVNEWRALAARIAWRDRDETTIQRKGD